MLKIFQSDQKKKREYGQGDRHDKDVKGPAEIRIQKELSDLDMPPSITINLEDDILNFSVTIQPEEGLWKDAKHSFAFFIPKSYPYDPPKVKCLDKIYHPNIDFEGHICLNILREDWKPILGISSIIYGLLHLLLEPNPIEGLNTIASDELEKNPEKFAHSVRLSLLGEAVHGEPFERKKF